MTCNSSLVATQNIRYFSSLCLPPGFLPFAKRRELKDLDYLQSYPCLMTHESAHMIPEQGNHRSLVF